MQKVRTWVPVLLGPVDELGLVDHVGDVLEDQGGQLHPHTDVDLVVGHGQAQLTALLGKPLCPGPAGAAMRNLARYWSPSAVSRQYPPLCLADGGDGGVELEGDVPAQVFVEIGENPQVVLRAQVFYPGLEEVEVKFQGLFPQGLGGGGLRGKDLPVAPWAVLISST